MHGSLGIGSAGTVLGWGLNFDGQATPPPGAFTAVAAGGFHSLGIRSDGTLVGWGDNSVGQISPQAGTFTAVAAPNTLSNSFSLAIRSDGTLAGWGNNSSGQTDVPADVFTAVSAGNGHGLALRARTDYDGNLLVDGPALGMKAQLNRSVTVAGDASIATTMTTWNNPVMEVGGKLRFLPGADIGGPVDISAGGLEVATPMSLDPDVTLTTTGPWTGSSDLALNGARVTAQLTPFSSYNGHLTIYNGGILQLGGSGQLTVGSLENYAQVRIGAGQRLAARSALSTNGGLIQVIGNSVLPAELEFAEPVVNAASTGIIDTRNAIVHFDGGLANAGSYSVGPGSTDTFGDIGNGATGRIAVTGGATAVFHDDMTQNGSLTVSKVGSTTSIAVFLGGFTGSGGFTGGGDVFFEGDLQPGNSPASVLMDGNVFFGPGSQTQMELAGLTQGSQYDHLTVTGTLTLGGTLDVVLLNPFSPAAGNTFDLFDGTLSGTFASINLPSLDPGLSWDTSALYTTGTLSVIPEPATLALLAISGLLAARRRVPWSRCL